MIQNDVKLLVIHPGFRHNLKGLYEMILDNFNSNFVFIRKDSMSNFSKKHQDKISFEGFDSIRASELTLREMIRMLTILYKKIIDVDPDVILTSTEHPIHSKIAYFLSRIMDKKLLIWTESWMHIEENFSMKIYHSVSRYILKNADAVLVHGRAQKKYCVTMGIEENNIFLFPFAINDLQKTESDTSIQVPTNKKVILYVGRLNKQKGIEYLLKAFKKYEQDYKDSYLLIVGTGEHEEYYRSLSDRLQIQNIIFYGQIPIAEIKSAYDDANLFVLPSCRYRGKYEGWGLVLNEATSMALPVIATDAVGSAQDLIQNGINGYIVKNKSVDELFNAMKKIIENDDLRERMGKESRKIFERYNDHDKSLKALNDAVEHALRRKR